VKTSNLTRYFINDFLRSDRMVYTSRERLDILKLMKEALIIGTAN
jgi:hypothetical protein